MGEKLISLLTDLDYLKKMYQPSCWRLNYKTLVVISFVSLRCRRLFLHQIIA